MIYRFLYYVVGWTLQVFYRKIYINGADHLEKDQSYILACNHPAGFVEPLILACFMPRDLYFLTRGDLFENKFYNYIFTATHQIPIFRFRDGFSNLRNNQQSISKAVQTLKEKKALLIFAEGTTSYQFDARPLQKGFARIGFQAMTEDPDLNLKVIPVGISFSKIDKMGGDVILNLGNPIAVNHYFSEDASNAARGMNTLVEETHEAMKKLMLTKDPDADINIIRSSWSQAAKDDPGFLPKIVYNNDFFDRVQDLIKKNTLQNLIPEVNGKKVAVKNLFWVLALPSVVFTFIPRLLSDYYKNTKVDKVEFKIPVALAVGLISYLIQCILLFIIGTILVGILAALMVISMVLLSGLFHLAAWENSHKL